MKTVKQTDHRKPVIRSPKDQIERYTHPNDSTRFKTDTPEGMIPYHWKVRTPEGAEIWEFQSPGPATEKS